MIGIYWGLVGALFIGVSDGIVRVTAQRLSITILILFIMGITTIFLSFWYLIGWKLPVWDFYSWMVSILSGFLNLVAVGLLYKALARGPVYLASPTSSSFAIFLILFNALHGEPYTLPQLLSGIVVFVGIFFLSRPKKNETIINKYSKKYLQITALLGLGAGITIALRFFLAQEAVSILGPVDSLYLNRVSSFIFILFFFICQQIRLVKYSWPKGTTLGLVFLQSLLENIAIAAFLFGSIGNGRIGATIGFSAYAVITTITTWVWLGEKVPLIKSIWIIIITAAVINAIIFAP